MAEQALLQGTAPPMTEKHIPHKNKALVIQGKTLLSIALSRELPVLHQEEMRLVA